MSTAITRPIDGPAVWHGKDLALRTDWIRPVTAGFVAELDDALRGLERRGLRWPDFGAADFPLPTLAGELAAIRTELEHGRGLVLLRGLPVERYTLAQLRQLYWGLGVHLGTPRHQNATGELIGEVRDEVRLYGEVREVPGASSVTRSSRARARTSGPLRFHTDRCDVVTLLCVRRARRGGESKVCSSIAVSNTILERRPDLHAVLCRDYVRNRQGEEAGGERMTYAMPVFAMRDGHFDEIVLSTFTPESIAIVRSCCTARIARPVRVKRIRAERPAIRSAVTTMMTSSAEPRIWAIGSMKAKSGMRCGKGRKSGVWASWT